MSKKFLFGVIAFLLFAGIAFASSTDPLIWSGMGSIFFDKESFTSTEPITGFVQIDNLESYPVVGGSLVLQLAQGEFSYPSQFSTRDNVVYEDGVNDLWVLPSSSKKIPFVIPTQKPGSYRLDAYFKVITSKLLGASWIFLSPSSREIVVTGSESVSRVTIMRDLTQFNETVGPVGFPIEPNGKASGLVFIANNSDTPRNDLKLKVVVCEWSSQPCKDPKETILNVPSIGANDVVTVPVELTSSSIPSAYEINLIVYGNNGVESIYKNRMIVSGGTSKPRKIFLKGLGTGSYSLGVFLYGSPDHFNSPSFEDFSLNMDVFLDNDKIQSESLQVNKISFDESLEREFKINPKQFSRICVSVKKQNTTYNEECFSVDLNALESAYDYAFPELVKVQWAYNESTKSLDLSLTKKKTLNSKVRIFSTDKTIFEDDITLTNNYNKSIPLEKANLTMTVDDFDAKRQQVFYLNLALSDDKKDDPVPGNELGPGGKPTLESCKENICSGGNVCPTKGYSSIEGVCCSTACVPFIENAFGQQILFLPLIVWLAIIILLIAIAVVITVIREVKRR